jgi:outer membrane protein
MSDLFRPAGRRPGVLLAVLGWLGLAPTPTLAVTAAEPLATVELADVPADARLTLGEAQRLLGAGDAAGAYALLAAREADWAGAPLYDYLFGVAALDSGRISDARFSLERVVAAAPDFDGARMELARAQFEAADLEGARTQFNYLAGRSPPPATAAVISRYLAAIDSRIGARGNDWNAFVEVGGGYDSNANASTSDEQFGIFILNDNNVETDSAFGTLAAGIGHQAGYGNGLASASSLRGDWRVNPDARFVDQATIGAGSTLFYSRNAWRSSVGVNGYYGWLDGSPQEAYAGLNLGVARLLGDRWELGARAQGGPVRFQQDVLEVLDVNRLLGSLTLTRFGLGTGGGRVSLSLLAGTDDARQSDSPFGNDRLGTRLSAAFPISSVASLYLEGGWLQADYDDSPGFFGGANREDDQYNAIAAVEFNNWPAADWVVAPRIRYTRNDSTISLYDYDRWEAAVTLRRAFR